MTTQRSQHSDRRRPAGSPRAGGALGITLAERAAQIIRERILGVADGFEPGRRLYPNQLAADLGVSMTPAREALKILAAEGLIDFSPRRGTHVTSLSPEELAELLGIRGGLEIIALRLRTAALTDSEIGGLRRELDDCDRALAAGTLDRYRGHHLEFHRQLAALGHSPRLLAMWEQTRTQAQLLAAYLRHDPDSARQTLAAHRDLVVLLAKTAPADAGPALWRHWEVCGRVQPASRRGRVPEPGHPVPGRRRIR